MGGVTSTKESRGVAVLIVVREDSRITQRTSRGAILSENDDDDLPPLVRALDTRF